MWLGRRAPNKPTYPGKLDQMVRLARTIRSRRFIRPIQLVEIRYVCLLSACPVFALDFSVFVFVRNDGPDVRCAVLQVAGGLAAGQTAFDCARKECLEEASVSEELIAQLRPVSAVRCVLHCSVISRVKSSSPFVKLIPTSTSRQRDRSLIFGHHLISYEAFL